MNKGLIWERLGISTRPLPHLYYLQTHYEHQICHLFEIHQFVESTRGAYPVILVGDFNTRPHNLAYSLITRCLRLRDIYTENFHKRASNNKPRRAKNDTIDFIFVSDEFCMTSSLTAKVCYL